VHPEEQQRVLKQLVEGLANNTSADAGGVAKAPVTDFTCIDLLTQEQQTFFRDGPLLLGLSTDLPGPNTYFATSEADVPLLLTRNRDGGFQAFLNVCRHRGVQLVEDGRGTKARFTCPFHAWTYGNGGDLIAINREEKFGCIDKGEYGLTELPAVESHGMLWVRPSPGADFDVVELLGGLAQEFESWDFPAHAFNDSQVIDADINWKLAIDTFGENYHFDVLHRDTLASDIYGNLQTHDVFDKNYRMVFASKPGFKHARDHQMPIEQWPYRWITLNVYFVFPNVILLVDPVGVDVLRMYPDRSDPAKSRTHHSFYMNPELAARREAEGIEAPDESRFVSFNRVVVDEDYVSAASVQANALSGAQTHFTFGRNEPALHHYHNAHRRGLGLPPLELIDA
jgi:phenylpropionate dioxygenase-like ring-hydroxylating dioxygenase large terminal subunit